MSSPTPPVAPATPSDSPASAPPVGKLSSSGAPSLPVARPLEPRKKTLVAMSSVFTAWVGLLIWVYFTQIQHRPTDAGPAELSRPVLEAPSPRLPPLPR